MNKKTLQSRQAINAFGYVGLQLLIQAFLPMSGAGCFVYIGFFLLQPWRKKNLVFQLLIAFGLGLAIDILYNSAGVNAFAAVLLVYCRYMLHYILSPASSQRHKHTTQPTLSTMGARNFALYALLLVMLYHSVVFMLDTGFDRLSTMGFDQLIKNILLSYFCIFGTVVLSALVTNSYTH